MTVRTVSYRCPTVTGGSHRPLIYIMSVVVVSTQLVGIFSGAESELDVEPSVLGRRWQIGDCSYILS